MIKHDEDCPKQEREFPCCEDQMCPCDRDAFEKLQAELDATLMALNIEKQKNARYREALENASARSHEVSCDWFNPNDDKCNCILSLIHKALKGE